MKASELKNMDLRELIDELNSLDFENVGVAGTDQVWSSDHSFGACFGVGLFFRD